MRRRLARRLLLALGDEDTLRPARTRPGSGGPTTAGARCTRAGCCASTRKTCSPIAAARTACGRVSTAAIAGSASSAALQYHWSVSHGSMTTPERSWCGTISVWSSTFSIEPRGFEIGEHLSCAPRSGRARDRLSGTASFRCASRSKMLISCETVPPADLEIVEIVRRRDLDRAAAHLRVGILVGDDRDQPADQRQPHRLADQIGEARDPPDAPRRRYRRASSPAGSSRRRYSARRSPSTG